MVNIKVAVRVRPFSQREINQKDDVIVRSKGKSIFVTDPKVSERQNGDSRKKTRRFVVDFCFEPDDEENGSQEAVYRDIGSEVLACMFDGYNACVFAYGHSATGKTYTMMGVDNDQGLTPRICQGLFEKINVQALDRVRFNIFVSFLEIYNEKVRDLLANDDAGITGSNFSLRVREHPKLGPYVQDLSQHAVTEKKQLLEYLQIGSKRRSTATTENNIYSSRSHAVFTIRFQQTDERTFETDKFSKVHLVDLAGSERANSTQTKARLKEGANINKSLVTLGNVISALAESCEGFSFLKQHPVSRTWQPFVPYRDSVLTWLLKDTLGGNSHTIMIATVSPASSCFSDTINTLRYARRTKRIVNQPMVNEDPKTRTIRELRLEIARLKNLLLYFRSDYHVPFKEENFQTSFMGRDETDLEETTISLPLDKETNGIPKEEVDGGRGGGNGKADLPRAIFFPGIPRAVSAGGDACRIGYENKSDVNGSVIDDLSHETRFFSDSLESFSPVPLEPNYFGDAKNIDFLPNKVNSLGDKESALNILAVSKTDVDAETNLQDCSRRGFSSCENLMEKSVQFERMLHKNRPDLIKGIGSRSREELPSAGSQSCTDSSQSTSENSLNLSGTADGRASSKKSWSAASSKDSESANAPKDYGEENSKEKNKRSKIVNEVTTRLYATKDKPANRAREPKAEGSAGGPAEDPKHLKICKGAKMKLFDLGRKLAISRKSRKMTDNDTQTDFPSSTVRVKEKSVVTEENEFLSGENSAKTTTGQKHRDETRRKIKKACLILNQVFLPERSNPTVECGKTVRIKVPGSAGDRRLNFSANGIAPDSEESFSDDSLEADAKSTSRRDAISENVRRANAKSQSDDNLKQGFDDFYLTSRRSFDSLAEFRRDPKSRSNEDGPDNKSEKVRSPDGSFMFFKEKNGEEVPKTNSPWPPPPPPQDERWSSDNSTGSLESLDATSSGESTSEEFIFYEGAREAEPPGTSQPATDRELYIITENGEPSEIGESRGPPGAASAFERNAGISSPTYVDAENSPLYKFQSDSKEKSNKIERFPERSGDSFVSKKASDSGFFLKSSEKASKVDSETCVFSRTEKTADANNWRKSGSGDERVEADSSSAKSCWKDVRSNDQKQFLNLNVLNSSKSSSFSIDTQLFGKARRKDESAEAAFASQDSITLVFMGPAKPKTSVLMEIIRKSLKENSSPNEVSFARPKAVAKGIRADSNLMRSISVDTAMIALSRIAKNQERPLRKISKAKSLDALLSDEENSVSKSEKAGKFRDRGSQCDLDAERFGPRGPRKTFERSLGPILARSRRARARDSKNYEKPKKSVSWFGKNNRSGDEAEGEIKMADVHSMKRCFSFDSRLPSDPVRHFYSKFACGSEGETEVDAFNDRCDFPSFPSAGSKNVFSTFHERRVRFSNVTDEASSSLCRCCCASKENIYSADTVTSFLKEATRLLKNLNRTSAGSCRTFRDHFRPARDFESDESNDFRVRFKKPASVDGEGPAGTARGERPRIRASSTDVKKNRDPPHSTWPRRRPPNGKPPSGSRCGSSARSLRSPFPSSFDSDYSGAARHFPFAEDRAESNGANWNSSDLSVPSSVSSGRERGNGDVWTGSLPDRKFFKKVNSRLSERGRSQPSCRTCEEIFGSGGVPNAETDLEKSFRRLESAVELEKIRCEKSSNKKGATAFRRFGAENTSQVDFVEENESNGKKRTPAVAAERLKRVDASLCLDGCICKTQEAQINFCTRACLKSCRSSFELDSFGPGSNHCKHFCMFCGKKNSEAYHSSPTLNSACEVGRCRLDFYGFCPCFPFRLPHVASSPRAYVQHLLQLRRRVVGQTQRCRPPSRPIAV